MIAAEVFTKAKERETDKGLKMGTLFVHSRHRLALPSSHVHRDWNQQKAER
jgi:hypothetical protein